MSALDPTRVDIADDGGEYLNDPRVIMQRGYARHGMTPFECPIISEIEPGLWMGGCRSGLVLPDEIDHVVSLYPWEAYEDFGNAKSLTQIYMLDDVEQSMEMVRTVALWVNGLRQTGAVLVHCQAGLNRSGLVTATSLVLRGAAPDKAIELLREKRSPAVLCNPAFEKWVLDLWAGV